MKLEELFNKLNASNLKQVHRDTKIPYDRMAKWTQGRGKPKKEDFDILVDYFTIGKSSIKNPTTTEENSDEKELIIDLLKNNLKEKEKLYESLISEKDERLKDKDIIIASKEEELMLLKEKVIEYEKKISTSTQNFGNEGHAHSTKRPGK